MDEMGNSQGDVAPSESESDEPRGPGAPLGNRNAVGNKGGHGGPEKFKPEYVERVQQLCERGLTDRELAEEFGVTDRTIRAWKANHVEFASVLRVGKDIADDRVERSLYEQSLGYTVVEQQAFKVKTGPHSEEVEIVDVEKFVPGNPVAAKFWLINRRRETWRDKVETGITDNQGKDIAGPATLEDARVIAFALEMAKRLKAPE
jgi:transcriptional regulator with XRE-family HTH domain